MVSTHKDRLYKICLFTHTCYWAEVSTNLRVVYDNSLQFFIGRSILINRDNYGIILQNIMDEMIDKH